MGRWLEEHAIDILGELVGLAILCALAAVFALIASSCAVIADPDPRNHERIATAVSNAVHAVTEAARQGRDARRDEAGEASGVNSADPAQTAKPAKSGGAPVLVWKYGGFDGSRAAEDPNTQIKDLHITKSKLTYKWAKGSLKNWGLADTDAGAIACCFFWDGKQWIGAKTDWISTSRTSRDFKNLNAGYNGWKPELYWAATKRAFCIASRDGKKRTNLIETEEPK